MTAMAADSVAVNHPNTTPTTTITTAASAQKDVSDCFMKLARLNFEPLGYFRFTEMI